MEEPGWDMGLLVCALRGDETDPPRLCQKRVQATASELPFQ